MRVGLRVRQKLKYNKNQYDLDYIERGGVNVCIIHRYNLHTLVKLVVKH